MLKINSIILTLILSTGLFSQGIDMRDEAIEAELSRSPMLACKAKTAA